MAEQMHPQLKRRILMFYFAAGINIMMAMWVISVGSAQVSSGFLGLIAFVFLAFAGLNFYVAKHLKKKWEEAVRERAAAGGERVNE